jgi:SAM-dependent methyltransferase
MLCQLLPKWVVVQFVVGVLAFTPATAQPATTPKPTVGQQGKDVIWLPTSDALVNRMLDMAQVTAADYVIDLGSGDGRAVIAAAKRGAKALGIEYEPALVDLSVQNAAETGVSDRATFMKADLFEIDFSQATVVTMFLTPDINLRLRPRILDMRPGTRVVSNTFNMGDWVPDQTTEAPATECKSYCRALSWVVPARVAGTWRLEDGELAFEQKFQMVSGTMSFGNVAYPITNGRLRGEEITFTAAHRTFTGRINGNVIEGVSGSGASRAAWRATRA